MRTRIARFVGLWSLVVLCAADAAAANSVTVVVPGVDVAAPGQDQSDPALIVWQAYDRFAGATLDASLWRLNGGIEGTFGTGPSGLSLVPTPLAAPGHTDVSISATIPIALGSYFAARVPFTIVAPAVPLPGNVDFNIDICGPDEKTQCDSVAWAQANHAVPPTGGAPLTGTFFFAEDGIGTFRPTSVLQGQLAMVYRNGRITDFFDDGSGWQAIGASFLPPPDWTPGSIPLHLVLSTNVNVVPVPEPSSLVLLGVGLLGVVVRAQVRPRRCS